MPAPKVNGALVAFHLTPPGERLEVPSEPRFLTLVRWLGGGWLFGAAHMCMQGPPRLHGPTLALPSFHQFLPPPPTDRSQVKKAFSQRRKVARNALRPLYEPGQVAVALQAAGISVDARAQDLTLAEFGGLAWALERTPADAVLPAVEADEGETATTEEDEDDGVEYAP